MDTFVAASHSSAEQTMELLWSRVRQRGDLPGFSRVVNAIVGAMRGDDDRDFSITRTVLQDPALTQKVLRLANSAMYSMFGQAINTVSKAVIVLGTEAIGHLALGLKLIDGLSAASQESGHARAELERAVLAGHIARQVASAASKRDAEEAVVCSILHSLGRVMVTFYLPERWQSIQAQVEAGAGDEASAALQVLGLRLDQIGRRAARRWGLPAALVDTLRDVMPSSPGEPLEHREWLAAVSSLSARCAAVLDADGVEGNKVLADLAVAYAEMLGLTASDVLNAVESGIQVATEEDTALVQSWKRSANEQRRAQACSGKPSDAAAMLESGVADLRGVLQSASTAQLMSMALETVYQGLGFSRAIAFVRKRGRAQYAAVMYLGEGVQEMMPGLAFPDAYQPDVFHAALANDKMIFVEDPRNPAFVNKVPRWWKEALPTARSFMVLPLTVNGQPAGFIYGDWDLAQPPAGIDSGEVAPLNELRLLLMHVLEQRRNTEPAWARSFF